MQHFIDFFSFTDPNVRYVVLGNVLLSASAAMVGVFILLQKKALVGDAVSHAVLPGICAAFLFSGSKNTAFMLVGAFITGWLALITIDYIATKSKLKKDAAIGLVLSVFFGAGMVMMTYIQQSGNAAQSGLDHFIFGKAATLIGTDLVIFSVLAAVLLVAVGLFFKAFALVAFDRPYAEALGYPVRKLDLLLTSLTVLAVVTGITAVGVVLMAAMLVTPGAAARYWTDNIRRMVAIAVAFGVFAGLAGAYISYTAPAMPTGPWMVVVSSIIAFVSFFFAPKKGIVPKLYTQRKNQRIIAEENTLKMFYHLGERNSHFKGKRDLSELIHTRQVNETLLKTTLRRLATKQLLIAHGQQWALTDVGYQKAARVVRLHRLWELYLTQYMDIAADHVHDDAETIEHILTPELERELEHQLGYPKKDPHNTEIPKI
ncbi:metal ABC transporter permease [Parapedobacter indicus]|uniref:Manganese/zinc/iron transport system permease protein n=1 Tax=Parapedobacter indicus TaxID=1477437 RepID=A0A1I3EX06_9SPHI|nr:iron chelate uptake ABC transporter family permease subunit [Parapedobacter indicus]PPL03452.1 manganese/zinc/iron transport system permease protein [Parapedobacter indicus]SFI03468.1 manganese/zinc/iron transport system permease protein [Parapedobacter indicus]